MAVKVILVAILVVSMGIPFGGYLLGKKKEGSTKASLAPASGNIATTASISAAVAIPTAATSTTPSTAVPAAPTVLCTPIAVRARATTI